MGEIADMMIDGTLDYVTGEYIGEPVGYPRTRTVTQDKRRSYNGVMKFLTGAGVDQKDKRHEVVLQFYMKELGGAQGTGIKTMCLEIQNNFHKFRDYVLKK